MENGINTVKSFSTIIEKQEITEYNRNIKRKTIKKA